MNAEVEVKHLSQGWFLSCGDRVVGPFKFLDQVDHVQVAQQLGVEPKDVWKAKISIQSFQVAPKILEVGTREIIELENTAVKPSFEGLSERVHPAIDIIGNRAVVGVALPCLVMPAETKKGKEEKPTEQELWFFITSLREKILANIEVLQKLSWRLSYRPAVLRNRWSLKSIEAWLSGAEADPVRAYTEVKEALQYYIEFDDPVWYDYYTLWIIGTYFSHLFSAYPYAYIGGVKRTGKTKVLILLSCLCFNAIPSANMSTSSVFRLIQSGRCTLLIDEVEKLVNPERAQDFRSLLLCGYKKGMPVYRTEKTKTEKLVPEPFEVYSPKALANIKGIEDVLEDRCIDTIMKRGRNKEIVNREIDIHDPIWQETRDQLYLLFLTYWDRVLEIYQSVGSEGSACYEGTGEKDIELSDRELELWKPIFTLVRFFDTFFSVPSYHTQPSLLTLISQLAKTKTKEKRIENMTETGDYLLIQTLLKTVKKDDYYKVKEVKDSMALSFDEEQKWLTTEWVGRALKRLGFTDKRRVGTGVEYRLTKEKVEDLANRLGIEKPQRQFEIVDVLNISYTSQVVEGNCGYCGKEGAMNRIVNLYGKDTEGKVKHYPVCDDCAWEIENKIKKGD